MNYKFLVEITDYIILYPIRWYNFLKRVIRYATKYNNILIITKKHVIDEKTFEEFIKILSNNKVIIERSENIDFHIFYFKDCKYLNIFSNWLNLITLRAAVDIYKEVKCDDPLKDDFKIMINNKSIIVSDEFTDDEINYVSLKKTNLNNVITYTYSFFTFKRELEKKIIF